MFSQWNLLPGLASATYQFRPGPDLAMLGPWALFIVGALIEQAWLSLTQDGR